jgi:hypothetical protein
VQKNKGYWQQVPRLVNTVIWVFVAEVIIMTLEFSSVCVCLVVRVSIFVGRQAL